MAKNKQDIVADGISVAKMSTEGMAAPAGQAAGKDQPAQPANIPAAESRPAIPSKAHPAEVALDKMDQSLADLDALLAESAAAPVTPIVAESAGEAVGAGPADADVEAVLAEAAGMMAALAVPGENAQQEVEPPAAEKAEDPASISSAAQPPPISISRELGGLLILPLVIMDLPFSGLSKGLKDMIGYAAIATLVVASAAWLAGGFLHSVAGG